MLNRIRRAVRDQRYRLSMQAIEEMAEDGLESGDIESIILTGAVARRSTRDPRGTRYEIAGSAEDGRRARVICRLLATDVVLIIAAYAEEVE